MLAWIAIVAAVIFFVLWKSGIFQDEEEEEQADAGRLEVFERFLEQLDEEGGDDEN